MEKKFKISSFEIVILIVLCVLAFAGSIKFNFFKVRNAVSGGRIFYEKAFPLNIKSLFGDFIDSINDLESLLQGSLDKGYFTYPEYESMRKISFRIEDRFRELYRLENLKETGKEIGEYKKELMVSNNLYKVVRLVIELDAPDDKYKKEKYEITEERKAKINSLLDFCKKVKSSGAYSDDLAKGDKWIKHLEDWLDYMGKMKQ